MVQYMTTLDADLEITSGQEWYESYGWAIPTEYHGDVSLQAIEYDWLEESDDNLREGLLSHYPRMTDDEIEALIERARMVRTAGDEIEELLQEAVESWKQDDAERVMDRLAQASIIAGEHGGDSDIKNLQNKLLEPALEIDGLLIYQDISGVGHCWKLVRASDILSEDLDAIYELIVNDGIREGETTIDLRHYRWG